MDAVERLLTNPFFNLGKEHIKEQLLYNYRYALEFLVRNGVINTEGLASGYSLVNGLRNTDPANFAFVYLLNKVNR